MHEGQVGVGQTLGQPMQSLLPSAIDASTRAAQAVSGSLAMYSLAHSLSAALLCLLVGSQLCAAAIPVPREGKAHAASFNGLISREGWCILNIVFGV